VLKRLSVQDPEKAQVFADKLLSNPKNLPYTQWYHWSLLMSERRKEEAQQFAAEHQHRQSDHGLVPLSVAILYANEMQIAWPRVARTDTYTYFFGQKTWAPAVIRSKTSLSTYPASGTPRADLITAEAGKGAKLASDLCRDGSWLVRAATYVERNSHVEGKIDGNNVSEEIVEELQSLPDITT